MNKQPESWRTFQKELLYNVGVLRWLVVYPMICEQHDVTLLAYISTSIMLYNAMEICGEQEQLMHNVQQVRGGLLTLQNYHHVSIADYIARRECVLTQRRGCDFVAAVVYSICYVCTVVLVRSCTPFGRSPISHLAFVITEVYPPAVDKLQQYCTRYCKDPALLVMQHQR